MNFATQEKDYVDFLFESNYKGEGMIEDYVLCLFHNKFHLILNHRQNMLMVVFTGRKFDMEVRILTRKKSRH